MDEVWRGAVPAWRCGAGGELTMAAHLGVAMEALGALAQDLGLGAVFHPAADARLRPYRIEMETRGEARADAPMRVLGAVAAADAAALTARFDHLGEGDAPLAGITIHAAHVSARTDDAFEWPQRVRARLAALDLSDAPPAPPPGRVRPPEGLAPAGRGMFAPADADGAGTVWPPALLERIACAFAGGAQPGRCALTLHAAAAPGQIYRLTAGRTQDGGVVWISNAESGRALAAAGFDAASDAWPEIEDAGEAT